MMFFFFKTWLLSISVWLDKVLAKLKSLAITFVSTDIIIFCDTSWLISVWFYLLIQIFVSRCYFQVPVLASVLPSSLWYYTVILLIIRLVRFSNSQHSFRVFTMELFLPTEALGKRSGDSYTDSQIFSQFSTVDESWHETF